MATTHGTNERLVSTRIVFQPVKITEAPQGTAAGRRRRPNRRFLPRRDWRRPLTLTVAYRGNGACYVEIKARGRVWMADGHLCLLDVLTEIWEADEIR